LLWFLAEGAVEVVKDGVRVASATQPGGVFGELSALLGGNRIHSVQSRFFCDFCLIAFPSKGLFFYFENEVFGHLEAR
jgi:hypothetical protein